MTIIYRAFHVCAIASCVLVLIALSAEVATAAGTITFTSGAGFTGVPANTAADGQGGSTDIAGITVEVYGISDSDGTKLTASGTLEFHSTDWSVPPIVLWNGIGATYGMAIKATGDTHFKLTSVNFNDWGEWEGDEWTIEAFDNDISQGTRTFNGSTDGTNVALAQGGVLDEQFNNIDEVRIYKTDGSGSWFGINDIVIDTPVVNTVPTFVGSTTTLTVSQNSGATDIKGLLHVSDADASQTETWSQSAAPDHGTLGFSGATASSGSTDITPGGTITYQPAAGYIGTDTFTVQVSDGAATATRQITVTVIPPLTVTSIVRRTPTEAVTNADSLVFRVTFSTPVNNLSTGDFAVSGTTAIVTGVTSSDYIVCDATISGGNLAGLNGTVTLGFAAGQNITDTAGNAFTNTTPTGTNDNTYTVDNSVSQPSTPDMAAASDSGSSSTDDITSDTTPTITGTAEADATVTLYDTDGTTVLGTATATGGNWSITSSALGAGAHTLTATATDTAGNISAASSGLSVTIDITPPAAPSAPDLTAASDSGSSSTDNITTVTTPTITGTAEADATVTLYDTDGTTVLGTSTATGGNWSITSSFLGAGAHTLTAKATDTAGNVSAASSGLSVTIDTTGPATTVATAAFSADTGTSSTDFITNTAAQTISGTLSANLATGEMVEVSLDNGSTWAAATATTGQCTWSLAGQTLTASNTLKVRVADTAGNSGTVYSQAYLLDQAAPTVTSVGVPADATYDTGQNLDFTVNVDKNVTVTGTDSTLSLTVGAVSRLAAYQAKTATSITYRYTVQGGDIDNNGITVGALTLNTTSIRDVAGNDAVLTLHAVGATTGVLVDSLIPTATAATSATATGFSAHWGGVIGATGYYLDVATDSGFTSLVTGYNSLDVGSVTTSAVSGLDSGATYYYRVRAYNGSGISGNSNGIAVSTLPAAPTATSAGSVTFTGFSANWNSVASATGYYLDVATDSGFTSLVTGYNNLDVGSATSLSVTGLTAGTPYHYRVRAYNSVGTGDSSNSIALTTATTRVVTTTSDSGAGSLRQVVVSANPGDVVTFDAAVTGTISLLSTLTIDKDLTVTGPGAALLTVSGNGTIRPFLVAGATHFTLQNLTVANGTADIGGGIYTTSGITAISGCVFSGNSATIRGGAVFADSVITITRSVFSGNSATANGGAIYFRSMDGGMTIDDSLIDNNSAGQYGGGVYVQDSQVLLTNVTITGNSAAMGGGLYGSPAAMYLNLTNVTIVGNSATANGGGLVMLATAEMKNSIIANNSASANPDLDGAISSQGYNLVKDLTGATISGDPTGNLTGSDPLLGMLADNGGPTQTMMPISGSPAIDAASCASGPGSDQRGMPRPQDATCDMGAYERGVPAALTATAGTPQSTAINTPFATSLAARVVDSLGGVLDGISVAFAGPGSGAGISAAGSAVTNSSGIAAYAVSANGTAGSYTVMAAVSTLSAPYSLTNTTGIATVSLGNLTATYDGTAKAASATTTPAGLTVALTYDGSASAPTNAGSYAVVATVNDSNYTGTASGTLTIDKAGQAITFTSLPPKNIGGAPFTISATTTSGLPVAFASSNPAVATVSGSTVTIVGVGDTTITASQPGNANFDAALPVSHNLTVDFSTAPPLLTVSSLSDGATITRSTQNISGTVFDINGINSLTINGTSVTVNPDGSFSFPVQLVAGANSITVTATNTVGTSATDVRTITLDSTAPYLAVTSPPDNAAVTQNYVAVTGTVATIPGMIVTYTVNGSSPQAAILTDATFSFTANLTQGMNTIQISAVDSEGKTAQVKRTLSSLAPFSLAIASPDSDIRTVRDSFLLTGSVADNTTPVAITVDMDGQSYHPAVVDGLFQQQLSLGDAGVYRVSVTGIDENNSSQTVQRNIILTPGASNPFTIVDALQALMKTAGVVTLSADQILRLDVAPMVNGVSVGDGLVDIEDTIVILRMAVGLL